MFYFVVVVVKIIKCNKTFHTKGDASHKHMFCHFFEGVSTPTNEQYNLIKSNQIKHFCEISSLVWRIPMSSKNEAKLLTTKNALDED